MNSWGFHDRIFECFYNPMSQSCHIRMSEYFDGTKKNR